MPGRCLAGSSPPPTLESAMTVSELISRLSFYPADAQTGAEAR
jgi:hypothetical protein